MNKSCKWKVKLSICKKWEQLAQGESLQPMLVDGGTESYEREGLKVRAWQDATIAETT